MAILLTLKMFGNKLLKGIPKILYCLMLYSNNFSYTNNWIKFNKRFWTEKCQGVQSIDSERKIIKKLKAGKRNAEYKWYKMKSLYNPQKKKKYVLFY